MEFRARYEDLASELSWGSPSLRTWERSCESSLRYSRSRRSAARARETLRAAVLRWAAAGLSAAAALTYLAVA